MKVLITGGAGFIGSHLAEAFLNDGHMVMVVDDLSTGTMENVKRLKDHPIESYSNLLMFAFDKADVCVPAARLMPYDVVYHLASPASPRAYTRDPTATVLTNTIGTFNALQVAKVSNARFIYASSSEVYGNSNHSFLHESANPAPLLSRTSGSRARSTYALAKLLGERLVAESGLPETCCARIFNTYGPGMARGDGRVVPEFIERAFRREPLQVHGSGKQKRTFTYIDDTVWMLKHLGTRREMLPAIVNVGSDLEYSVNDVADYVVSFVCPGAAGIEHVASRPHEVRGRRPALDIGRKVFGHQTFTPLGLGLKRTVESYRV